MGSGELEVWRLEVGSGKLEVGSWRWEVGGGKFGSRKLEVGSLEVGSWRVRGWALVLRYF
jgi:hypothetical protein